MIPICTESNGMPPSGGGPKIDYLTLVMIALSISLWIVSFF
jgi:hypothetical protein